MSTFEWVTVNEAAELLGVSRGRVRQLLSENRVKGVRRMGRDWLIPTPIDIEPGTRGPTGAAGENLELEKQALEDSFNASEPGVDALLELYSRIEGLSAAAYPMENWVSSTSDTTTGG